MNPKLKEEIVAKPEICERCGRLLTERSAKPGLCKTCYDSTSLTKASLNENINSTRSWKGKNA